MLRTALTNRQEDMVQPLNLAQIIDAEIARGRWSSRVEFATDVGLAESHLSRVLARGLRNPAYETVKRLATALGLPPDMVHKSLTQLRSGYSEHNI